MSSWCPSWQNHGMRLVATAAVLVFLLIADASAQKHSATLTPQIQTVLRNIKTADTGQLSVSEEDGKFLRVLVATRTAKSILEIGGASGYSAIWLGLGARESGGRVVTIEYESERAREAAENIKKIENMFFYQISSAILLVCSAFSASKSLDVTV